MKDPTKLLWEIAGIAVGMKKSADRSGWELKAGHKIFSNPKVQCPNCGEFVQTKRIWLVDDRSNYLIKCWKMDGSRINPDNEIVHPHVNNRNGEVCLGTLKKASEALFHGVAEGR